MTGARQPAGTLFIVGMGPGDPDLVTVKAARVLARAPVVAFFAKRGRPGHARSIATGMMHPAAEELRFEYPFTTEMPTSDPRYAAAMAAFYDAAAGRIAAWLDQGSEVALLCEGDPFFYGSAMPLFDRLGHRYPAEIIPGVTGMSGCWARARMPITQGEDVLAVLPGTLDRSRLTTHLASSDAAIIMKVGRHLPKIRAALADSGALRRATYVERGTMDAERILPMAEVDHAAAPYFSMVLVPGRRERR